MSWREIEKDVKRAINRNYTSIIYKLDPRPVINHLRESEVLTVDGHDIYYEQLRNMIEGGKTKAAVNEKLLEILYTRENWWDPFRKALHKCGADETAKIIEDALANSDGQRRQMTRRYKRRSHHESESSQSSCAFSHSSGTKSLPLNAGNVSMRPISEVIYRRDQSPPCPDENSGHQFEEGMGSVQREGTESEREESDEKGEPHPSPEHHLGEADLGANLNDSRKPSLLPKHFTGTYEYYNQTGVSHVSGEENPVNGEESRPAMGNVPHIVPSEFPSSSSTEEQEILPCQDTDVNSNQLFGPGDIQQPQDDLYEDTTTGPSLSEPADEKPVEVEKYSSKCCLSERSENPSVHDRLAEKALNAQSTNLSLDGQDASQGTPRVVEVESPAGGQGEEPTVNNLHNGGSPVGNANTLTWRSIIKYSVMVFADNILRG